MITYKVRLASPITHTRQLSLTGGKCLVQSLRFKLPSARKVCALRLCALGGDFSWITLSGLLVEGESSGGASEMAARTLCTISENISAGRARSTVLLCVS